MPREEKSKQVMRARIAATAARIMAEDGIEDYALAKRKGARQLGAESTQALPNNDEIEAQLRIYQSLYQVEEHADRLRVMRKFAFEIMRTLEQFHPYLVGPVLSGTVGRYGDVDLQVFTDDSKSLEIFLLNRNMRYEVSNRRRFSGDSERAVPVLRFDWDGVPINISIYAANDARGTVQSSASGKPIPRAGLDAVALLVKGHE